MNKLKPCPFCGSENITPNFYDYLFEQTRLYAAGCLDCEAVGSQKNHSVQDAINAWNTRYDSAQDEPD